MLASWSPKGESWSQAFHAGTAETGDESATAYVVQCCPVFAIRKHHSLHKAVLCEDRFVKTDTLYAHLTQRRTRNSW